MAALDDAKFIAAYSLPAFLLLSIAWAIPLERMLNYSPVPPPPRTWFYGWRIGAAEFLLWLLAVASWGFGVDRAKWTALAASAIMVVGNYASLLSINGFMYRRGGYTISYFVEIFPFFYRIVAVRDGVVGVTTYLDLPLVLLTATALSVIGGLLRRSNLTSGTVPQGS